MSVFEDKVLWFDFVGTLQPIFLAVRYDSLRDVRMLVDVAFDDPAATATIGQIPAPTNVLSAAENDLTTVGEYANPGIVVANTGGTNEGFYLFVTPGTSTQGHGRLYYTIERQ